MRKEYELIAKDFLLQIDAPDLAMERGVLFQDKEQCRVREDRRMHVAALNEALAGIRPKRACACIAAGATTRAAPARHPMREILPVLYGAKVSGLSVEFANPRHQHEYAALKKNKLPTASCCCPRDRFAHQLRRASRGGGQPYLRSGRCGR